MEEHSTSEARVSESDKPELIKSLYTQDNVALEKEYLDNQKQCSVVSLELREAEEGVADLTSSFKSLQNEFMNVRMFLQAGQAKLNTEKNLLLMTKRDKSKIRTSMEELKKKRIETELELKRFEAMLIAKKDKLECLKKEKMINEERLNEWMEEFEEKEEDVHMYETYSRMDQSKIKELLLKISHLSDVYAETKSNFEKEATESKALKFSLNKMTEETLKCHQDRTSIIDRLHKLIQQTQRKESDINLLNKMVRDLEAEEKDKMEKHKEKEGLLDSVISENEDLRRKIEMMRDLRRKTKVEVMDMERAIIHLKGEHQTIFITAERTSLELELRRIELTHAKEEVMRIVDRLKKVSIEICELIKERDNSESIYKSNDEKAKIELNEMMANEMLKKKAEIELTELLKVEYANERKIKELIDRKKWLVTRMALTKKSYLKADEELSRMDKVGLQKMKFLFVKELTVQMMGRKVKQMEGHLLYLEQAELTEQIKIKTAIKDDCVKAMLFWSSQSRDVKASLHRIKYNWERTLSLKNVVNKKYAELVLQINIANKVLQDINVKRKDALIDESLHRMSANRLRGMLMKKAGQVLTLEKTNEQLNCHMQNMNLEIEANKLQFKSRIQLAKERNCKLSAEVEDKKFKAEQLAKKYEVLIAFVQSSNRDDNGDSVLSYAMKSVQEREELRMKGNQLDMSIKKAEKELKAMRNAVAVIRCTNQQKLLKGIDFTKSLEEKELLQNQLKKINVEINARKKQVKEAIDNIAKKKSHIEVLVVKFQEKNVIAQTVEEQWKSNQAALTRQELNLKRAIKMFQRRIMKNRNNANFKKILTDMEVNIIEHLNERALVGLFRLFEKFPNLKPLVEKKLVENDLKNPFESETRSIDASLADLHCSLSSIGSKASRTTAYPMLFLRKELKMMPIKGLKGYKNKTIGPGQMMAFKSPENMIKLALKKDNSDKGLNISEFFIKEDNISKSDEYDQP